MSIAFACPACQARITVAEQYAGREGKCPGCGVVVSVPARQEPPEDDAAMFALPSERPARRQRDDDLEDRRPKPRRGGQSLSAGQVGGVVGGGLILLCVILAVFLRIANLAKRWEAGRPAQPTKDLPRIDGRWEDGRGYIVFTPEDRQVDGRSAFHGFERSDGGPAEKGLAVAWSSSLDLPWQKGEYLMYAMDGDQIKRREKMRWQFDAETLMTWDEKGRKRTYRRK
jgi:hypothetical protein